MRILLTEDDDSLRGFVGRALECDGHTVDPACDGLAALAALDARGGQFDLLFSDVRMPLMDGLALARSIAGRWPRLPVLLMTGYADDRRTLAETVPDTVRMVLAKPFSLDEMRAAVAAAFMPCEPVETTAPVFAMPAQGRGERPAERAGIDEPTPGRVGRAIRAAYSVFSNRSR